MKKAQSEAKTWTLERATTVVRPRPVYLVSTKPAAEFHLPKLDHVMRLARSAELGIIALDHSGLVIEMNLAARELVATNDGLSLKGRSLEACSPPENAALADAVRAVIDDQGGLASRAAPVSMLRISRTRTSSLLVAVVPNGRPAADGNFGDLAALVLVSDPDRPLHESVRMLCKLYRLTPGETRLTEHLIDGFTLAEIAEIMSLKPSTVRVYLKQIFAKTGVKRQAMLIRLFLTSRMPFYFPEAYPIVSRAARVSTIVPERVNS
jgi:DNA-binding CsgD family transcriptional regulator